MAENHVELFLEGICSGLTHLKCQMPMDIKKLKRNFSNANWNKNSDLQQLANLMNGGYFPKPVLEFFLKGHSNFHVWLYNEMNSRKVFRVSDQDRWKTIFKITQNWYFIPFLVYCLSKNKISKVSIEDFSSKKKCHLIFEQLHLPLKMEWIVGLLFEFCHAHSVIIGEKVSEAQVGSLKVTLEITNKNCYFIFDHTRDDKNHCTLMMSSIIEVVSQDKVLSQMLKLKSIFSNVKSEEGCELDLSKLGCFSSDIIKEIEMESETRKRKCGETKGTSQYM